MPKKALIVSGGWEGHQPEAVARLFEGLLEAEGFKVELATSLDAFLLASEFDLVVPNWTMGSISDAQLRSLADAVVAGTGIAGCHGGMCDAFRGAPEYQFMTGGQWVAHPGDSGVRYAVNISDHSHPITSGLPNFEVTSEQYYLLVDPANHVLATTHFPMAGGPHVPNGEFDMPVVWTRRHGLGKVFYCSLGHSADMLKKEPVTEILRRGLVWAAK